MSQTFHEQNPALAREAYGALFDLLALKDAYGFLIDYPGTLPIFDEWVRFMRAVGEVASAGRGGLELADQMHHFAREHWEPGRLSVRLVIACAPMALDVREAWLDELIAALSSYREAESDRWLREAIRLRSGAPGLRELAKQSGPWRPRAWIDWRPGGCG